jgi:hypothetical protein
MMEPRHEASVVLMSDWFRRVRENQHVHYACGNYFSRLNYWLGIPTIILTSLVGTAVFASLEREDIGNYKILIGLVSVMAAVLASLQTFLGFSERSEKHRRIAAGYAAVRRKLELLKTFTVPERDKLEQAFAAIKAEIDDLANSSPEVPQRVRDRVYGRLKSQPSDHVFSVPTQK